MTNKIRFAIFLFLAFCCSAQQSRGQTAATPKSRCGTSFPSDSKIEWYCYQVKSEKALTDFLGPNLENVLRFNRIDQRHAVQGAYLKIPADLRSVAGFTPFPSRIEQTKNYRRYIFLDRAEQFLGAYEYGELKFSLPIASGRRNSTPAGTFKVLGRDRLHRSSVYKIEGTNIPYPMYWGIKFHVAKSGRAVWLHGRDMPGYPASRGCVGLYDEEMQKRFYGSPKNPLLMDSKKLYLWIFPNGEKNDKPRSYPEGLPDILIEIK